MFGGTFLLATFAVVLAAVYVWLKYTYSYWRRNNIPYLETTPFLGSLRDIFFMKSCIGLHLANLYNHPKVRDQPIIGIHILHTPALLIREPELIKRILVKDFAKFSNRYISPDVHGDLLGAQTLVFAKNIEWKEIRAKLTPVFTSGKIKQMLPLILEIANELDLYLLSNAIDPQTKSVELEIKEISACFTNDVVATVAFGVQVNSFKNPNNDFRINGKTIFKCTPYRAFEFFIIFFVPKLVGVFGCKIFSKESAKFLLESITYIIKERSKSGVVRNDLIDTLLAFKKEADTNPEKKKFATDHFMVAQAGAFFAAGFETASSTISFTLYELSKNTEIQKQLREEIKNALRETGGKITYEMIHELKLLNAVIWETLRLYPSVPMLERECTLTAEEESYTLEPFIKFSIPNGMPTYISNYALQRDPKYFPDPEKFDPERFSPENKGNINPYVYMPFGTGPRNCIGERLGLLQTRVGIVSFLRNHYVATGPKTPSKISFDPKTFTLQTYDGIFLNIVRDPLL